MAGPYETIADRVEAAAAARFVGRSVELAALLDACEPSHPAAVVLIHGPGGIGKTALLDELARRLNEQGRRVLALDGAQVEPTAAAFTAAIAARLDVEATVTAIADQLASAPHTVLLVDAVDRLRVLDDWVRRDLLPRLPATTTTVLASRSAPSTTWKTSPGWQALAREVPLEPLPDHDALLLLEARGVDPASAARIQRFARGYPLALELAAAAVQSDPGLSLAPGPTAEVIGELVAALLHGLDASTVDVLDRACVVRRVTQPLLAGLLDGTSLDARRAWDLLVALPFVHVTEDGAVLDEVVRDVLARSLELRDPAAFQQHRRDAAAHLAVPAGRPPTWAATADLLYLVPVPVARDAFFPPGGSPRPVDDATAEDAPAIEALARTWLPDGEDEVVLRWWAQHPEAFRIGRDDAGRPVGFGVLLERAQLDPDLALADPVVRAWEAHLATDVVPDGSKVLFGRSFVAPSDEQGDAERGRAPMFIDTKRTYLELRPALRRIYTVTDDWRAAEPSLGRLGFTPVGSPIVGVDHDGTLQPLMLDFGPGSIDGWLSDLIQLDVGPPSDQDVLIEAEAAERVATLSPREHEVVALLAEGLTNRQVAERLFISERTANRHVSNIFTKLGVSSRAAAAVLATRAGMERPMERLPDAMGSPPV